MTGGLREHPFFAGMPDPLVARATNCVREQTWAPGALLLREGAAADAFFLLRRGRVVLEVHVPGRGEVRVESLGGGDVLGLSWLFPPYRWQLDARAVEEVSGWVLDARCLRGQMEDDAAFGYALTQRLLALTWQRLFRVRLQRLDLYRAEP